MTNKKEATPTPEDIAYLIDFITKTLRYNDEEDPFELDEAEYLLELKGKLRALLAMFDE